MTAFRSEAEELGIVEQIGKVDPEQLGRDLAHAAQVRIAWTTVADDYITVQEAKEFLGLQSRQAVYQRIHRGTVLAMELDGQWVLPRYQFAMRQWDRRVARVLRLLKRAQLRPDSVVSWFATVQPELDGKTPAEWLKNDQDPEVLYDAARHTASALAH